MSGEIFDDLQEVRVGFAVKLLSLQVESRKNVTIEKPTRERVLARSISGSLSANCLLDIPFPLQVFLRSSTAKIGNGKILGSRLAVARTGPTLEGQVVFLHQVLPFRPLQGNNGNDLTTTE